MKFIKWNPYFMLRLLRALRFHILNFIKIAGKKIFIQGSPLWVFHEFWKISISSADEGEKYFSDQYLILHTMKIKKIPTSYLVNFVRVDQSLQLNVFVNPLGSFDQVYHLLNFLFLLPGEQYLNDGRFCRLNCSSRDPLTPESVLIVLLIAKKGL